MDSIDSYLSGKCVKKGWMDGEIGIPVCAMHEINLIPACDQMVFYHMQKEKAKKKRKNTPSEC